MKEKIMNLSEIMDRLYAGPGRMATDENDFGDEKTIGLHVKRRIGKNETYKDYDFGVFIGKYGGAFHICTMTIMADNIKLETFNTLEELKEVWKLD